jgi:hypothetical protein
MNAANTSTIYSYMNNIVTSVSARYTKAVGATLNIVSGLDNVLAINNAVGAPITGTIVDKFVVTAPNGTPLGYVPVYTI